jgi:tetratricopeptide (TPR) repeat protein
MLSTHPTLEDLERFLASTSPSVYPDTKALVVRHLLADCAVCRERLVALHRNSPRLIQLLRSELEDGLARPATQVLLSPSPFDYGNAFAAAEQAISALLAPEDHAEGVEGTSIALLSELDALSPAERVRWVSEGGRFANPALVSILINRSHDARFQDADEMLHFADLARLAADRCSPVDPGHALRLADLKARAWGQYGNALRVSGRPREAEEAFATAQRHRHAGTGDPLLSAALLARSTPLALFQGRFEEAIAMCEEVEEIYRDLGEDHLLAATRVQKATATLQSGAAERAVRILNQTIPLIDHQEDPHLLLAACHNLIRCYIDLGRPDQALQIYSEIKELYEEFDDPLIQLRAAWQEGQLLRDLGHLSEAETILIRARKGYTERKLAYEVALVSLDLATVYVKLGLTDKLKRTVLETVPIFHALRVELETLAALLQLQQVADQEQQALDLIRALTARIEPLRRQRVEES